MQRRTAAACLVATSALLLLSQLRLLPQDQGVLLEVGGRPVDAAGQLLGAWLRLVRRCDTVTALADGSAAWQEVQRTLAGYSPPASLAARPVQVLSWGEGDAQWLLAEVRWGRADVAPLEPAIVPLARRGGDLQVQAGGVWSGDTGPWSAPVFIRRFLADRLPALPAPLRQCLDPQLLPFSR
jgi:hypothetical protein